MNFKNLSLPIQPIRSNESTDEYVKRLEEDAINNAPIRREFFRNEKCRERKKQVKDNLTGMALVEIGAISEVICFECGKENKNEPIYCYTCGCIDFMDVWKIEGEWYFTGEDYCKKAINVKIIDN